MSIEDTQLGKLLAPDSFLSENESSTFWTELGSSLSELVPKSETLVIEEEPITTKEENTILEKGPKKLLGEKAIPASYSSRAASGGKFAVHLIKEYATGGLADFTGPAWLDGTPSRPEYVLNAEQTERFFSLIDVLEGYDANKEEQKSTGDNYFDININVEKLEDDYDVEQMANKIRRMIYEDATYRNVNSINHIR